MLIVVATDVGAWRVVRPVLRELWRGGAKARAMLAEPAATFAAEEGIAHVALDQPSFGERVAAVLGAEPAALLLGTSPSDVVERAIVRELRQSLGRPSGRARGGPPTVGVLDAMLFAERRFGPGLRDLTDVIACPDEETAERLRRAGAALERVVVTGNPTLEEIATSTGVGCRVTGVGDDASPSPTPIDVLFISQSVSRVGPERPFAIDERTSLHDLLGALGALAELAPDGFRVRVRWHPTQRPDRLPRPPRNVRVERDDDPDRLRSVARAQVVVGISSTLLAEARMLPRPAIAYLPGPYWDRERVYASHHGVRRARSAEELRAQLAEALTTDPLPPPVAHHVGAARKVADLLLTTAATAKHSGSLG